MANPTSTSRTFCGAAVDAAALAPYPFFAVFSDAAREAAAPLVRRLHLEDGAFVFEAGDPPGCLYVIESGRAEVVLRVEDRELVLATLEAGEFFGEMGFVESLSRSTGVRAAGELLVLAVPADVLRTVEERDPATGTRIYRLCFDTTAERLRRTNEAIGRYFRERIERLERERREKEFIHLLAHDLRSPLSIIEGGIGQLLDHAEKYGPLADKQVRVLKRSRRSAVFLRQLLEEILEVGRSEAEKTRADSTTVRDVLLEAIPQCLARVDGPTLDGVDDPNDLDAVRRALAAQGLHVEAAPEILEKPMVTDRLRLIHVVMNLIGNALKYAPGWIAVRVAEKDGRAAFEVLDRGPGIPEEYRAGIFQRYRQSQAKAKGVPRGFGLGLAGAAELVRSLGGTIRAGGGDGGVGTKIAFDLPWRTD